MCSSLFCPSITSLVKADKPVSRGQMQNGRRPGQVFPSPAPPKRNPELGEEPRSCFRGWDASDREEAPRASSGRCSEGPPSLSPQGRGAEDGEQGRGPRTSRGRAASQRNTQRRQIKGTSPATSATPRCAGHQSQGLAPGGVAHVQGPPAPRAPHLLRLLSVVFVTLSVWDLTG